MINTRNDVETFMIAGDQIEKGFGAQSKLYMNLITEEVIHETLKGFDKNDIVEIADGIADSIWVIEGMCISLNISLDRIWNNVKYVMSSDAEEDDKEFIMENIISEYLSVRIGFRSDKISFIETPIENLIRELLNLSKAYNIPMQEVWDEVSRSNMSKISDNGKVIKNEFGKIQKPETFSPANIRAILEKHNLV